MTRIDGPGFRGIPPGGSQGGEDPKVSHSEISSPSIPDRIREILTQSDPQIDTSHQIKEIIDWWIEENRTAQFLPEPLKREFQAILHSILPDNPQVQNLVERLRQAIKT